MAHVPQAGFNAEMLRLEIQKFGGVGALLDRWHERNTSKIDGDDPPDRSTIYRWMQGTWPRTSMQLLTLCEILDLDPFCLIALSEETASAVFVSLYRSYRLQQWRPPALSFISDYVGYKKTWPPGDASRWHIHELGHESSTDAGRYQAIEIKFNAAEPASSPRVIHFAYKQPALFLEQWVQYGFVSSFNGRALLVSINGYVGVMEAPSDKPIIVETWFGPSPTAFRIASLHSFAARYVARTNDVIQTLKFPA